MKKGLIVLIAIVGIVVVIGMALAGSYNGLVEKQNEVEGKQAEIATQLQRRADLIPNFVATVKGYADYEQSVAAAGADAAAQTAASEQLDRAISVWVNAVTEAYPDLKANTQFVALQDELAGTENRVAKARDDYNAAAKDYNTAIRKFPQNLIAGMFGFEKADYFEAAAGTESAPTVSF